MDDKIKLLIEAYIKKVVKETIKQNVTEKSLKSILVYVVQRLKAFAKTTDSRYDDWIINLLESWCTDTNINLIWTALQKHISGSGDNVYCSISFEDDYYALTELLAPNGKSFASPTLKQVYNIVQFVMELLADWINGRFTENE